MPDCAAICDSALCEKHQIELRQRRLRAEVLDLVKARPAGFRARPARDPRQVSPDDYQPWLKPAWAANVEPAPELEEPSLPAQPCPQGQMPSGVRTAVGLAIKNDWEHVVTYAIGPGDHAVQVHSVLFRARKGSVALASRHEKVGEKPFGYKAGWLSPENRLPTRLGWRDVTFILGGLDWEVRQASELRDATLLCMDLGMDFEGMI